MTPSLSSLAVFLGLGMAVPHAYGVMNPAGFSSFLRKFPRSVPLGFVLMMTGTIWFTRNLSEESISDFEPYKPLLYAVFIAVGLGTCVYVRDFLAARGASVLMLLLAKTMLDSARWSESPWSLVIKLWAYAWVIAGMWFTISPWRMRDLVNWATATASRTRAHSAIRLAFGLFVLFLGLKAF